jgi:hypothetical protein
MGSEERVIVRVALCWIRCWYTAWRCVFLTLCVLCVLLRSFSPVCTELESWFVTAQKQVPMRKFQSKLSVLKLKLSQFLKGYEETRSATPKPLAKFVFPAASSSSSFGSSSSSSTTSFRSFPAAAPAPSSSTQTLMMESPHRYLF